jgi:hypothetical protein
MEALQDVLRRTQTGTAAADGSMQLSGPTLNNILKNDGAELAKVLTPDELQALRNVAADMNAGQLGLMAGKAVGSNTMQNAAQDQLLRAALGKLGASSLAQNTLGNVLKLPYIRANEQIRAQLGDALLDPQMAARLIEEAIKRGEHVPLSGLLGSFTQIPYRAAPLLPASAGQ